MAQDKKKKKKNSSLASILTGLLIGSVCVVFSYGIGQISFFKKVELMSLDARYVTRKPIDLYPNLGYVNLDNESCELAGDWPWARSYHVALVKTLGFYGARAAGYDVFYVEDSPINERPAPKLSEEMGEDKVAEAIMGVFLDHDQSFREALEESGVIYLGKFLTKPAQVDIGEDASLEEIQAYIDEKKQREQYKNRLPSLQKAMEDGFPLPESWGPYIERAVEVAVPIRSLSEVSQGVGFEQIIPDNITGTVYEYPMFLEYDGHVFPALGLLMAADILGVDLSKIHLEPNKYLEMEITKAHGNLKPGKVRIPVNEKMRMLMNWSAPYFKTYFHINFRQLSAYYGALQVKEMVRRIGADLVSLKRARKEIIDKTLLGNWVEPEEAPHLVDTIFASHFFSAKGLSVDKEKQISELVDVVHLDRQKLEMAFDAISLAQHVRKFSTEEDRRSIADRISLHTYLDVREDLYDSADYPALDDKHQMEIVRNVLFFAHEDKLEDVSPLYFPPCFQSHVDGTTRDISPTMLKDKVLMIGLEGEGTIDLNPQPYEGSCAMVALHANAINTFLTSQYLHFSDETQAWIWLIILSLVIAVVSQFLDNRYSFLAFLVLFLGYSWYCWNAFSSSGHWHQYVIPLLGLIMSYLCSVGLQLYIAFREKQKMKGMFGKMVSPDVLQVMSDNPDLFSLSGRRMSCTSYFSSMEGFPDISKGVTPQELTGLLGSYLTPASQIVTSYKGYIDKYEGHIIMADYGVPIPTGDHRLQCLYASIEQQLDICSFQHFIYARKGKHVNTSMGVNTGFVSAGNMGSDKKMQYTIMGDTVNTAARFRPANWIYDNLGSVIIGESTYPLVKDFIQVRPLDRLLLKGKLKPVNIYQVMGWEPDSYLEMRGEVDPTETLSVCWAKHCPPEKIYGYHIYWAMQKERTGNPMCDEISSFFGEHIEDCAELALLTVKDEIRNNGINYSELNERYREITDTELSPIPSGEWREKCESWKESLSAELKVLENEHQGNPEADKLRRDLLDVEEKIEALIERLGMELDLPDSISKTWDQIREYVGTLFEKDVVEYEELRAEKYTVYESSAMAFVSNIAGRRQEYQELLAQVGSMTEREKQGVEIYERALSLHWERKWDESIKAFREVLEFLPDDKPSLEFIGRLENYKEKPPGADWQGEFKQTKK